ncbi:MAG: carbohydrate-binding family 9-like protein [Candidatus Omnitrophica bacterium]|nr:carbohydrate-binding family 9-like protein [Candidatus Omnitrophota bacterium]
MSKKYFVLSFIFIFILGFKVKGQEKELIFSDDFSGEKISEKWKLDSPHSWEVKDGVLQTTKYGGSATIKEELPDDIIVEVKVKPIEANPELPGGFGGIVVSGINFVIRKEGFWWPYKRPGDERYSGGSKKSDIILGKWYQFKVIRKEGGIFEWYVDGEKICEIIEPVMKGKEVGFNAWRFKMAYDDIKVYKVTSVKQTGNLNIIRNSSFEILQDNLPIYWSPIGSLNLTYGGMENFLKLWCIDTNEKFHGKQSLRIEKGGVYSFYFSSEKNSPYVFSVYMKSDREQLPVELAIWEWNIGKFHKAVVNVDKEWKRYICRTETNQTGMLRVRVEKKDEGILWIDAVKLEKGTEPTEYTISPFDLDEKEEKREIKIEEYIIKKVDKPPVIDGELDDIAWQKSLKIEFLIAGEKGEIFKPKEKTEGYLCYDDKGIYIAFKCYDTQIDKIKADVKEDDGPVWNDDCVEIFLDTNNDKRTYYHIAINSLGKIKVIDKENNQPFKGKIERGVSIKKDHWIVEVIIPFSSLNITSQTSQVWGFNLGRENHKIGEYSCTSPTKYLNFHDVENYNLLVFPEKELFKKYIVEKKEEKKLSKKRPFIVDGKPFFVFAPLEQFFFGYNWFYKDGWENEIEKKIKFWKDEGFRSIVVVSKIFPFEMSEKGWAKLFEIANKYDLKLVVWPGFNPKEGIEKNFEKFIEKYKENKCIIAWCVGDEPEIQSDVKPEEIIEVVKRAKQVDPKHPVFVNYTPLGPSIRYAGLPGDILSTDLYITAGRTIREVVELVKLKDKIAREKNMWVWMWLVGNNMYNHFREPTAEEQEGQTYGAIISGCTGLMYFYGECFGYKNWMKLKQLSKETEILAPIIFSEEIEGIESNHPDILTMGRNYGNKYYVFSVNINKNELDGKIILPKEMKKYKKCKVVFENREIEIKDSIIIDKFSPYQRHVYELMK